MKKKIKSGHLSHLTSDPLHLFLLWPLPLLVPPFFESCGRNLVVCSTARVIFCPFRLLLALSACLLSGSLGKTVSSSPFFLSAF